MVSDPRTSRLQSAWLRQTKRLFPHPLFAGCISVACLLVGILLAGAAIVVRGAWFMAIPSLAFLAGCFATAAAAIIPDAKESPVASHQVEERKPTFAIFVLLISIYSWLLMIGMTIFRVFFNNGPGSTKYYVTLGIAISSTIFMKVYGRRIVQEYFGAMGGKRIELSGRQAIYVTLFVMFTGVYFTWLMT